MNRRSAISMGLLLVGSAILWHSHDAVGQTGWTTLFDGSHLNLSLIHISEPTRPY